MKNKLIKSMFITLEEFIENGGILEKDREIYSSEYIQIGYYKNFDDNTKSHLIYNNSYKSFPISTIISFVKIKVKAIYK